MSIEINVVEIATLENFFESGYLMFNPDVKKAGVDAFDHFSRYGKAENRKQFTKEIIDQSPYRMSKYNLFKDIIIWPENHKSQRFPVLLTDSQYDLCIYEGESMNEGFGPFIDDVKAYPNKLFLDLGCGLRNKCYSNCLYLEVYPSVSADLVIEADKSIPILDSSFDAVGCFNVLEHTRRPWEVSREIYRILKPGGKIYRLAFFTAIAWGSLSFL